MLNNEIAGLAVNVAPPPPGHDPDGYSGRPPTCSKMSRFIGTPRSLPGCSMTKLLRPRGLPRVGPQNAPTTRLEMHTAAQARRPGRARALISNMAHFKQRNASRVVALEPYSPTRVLSREPADSIRRCAGALVLLRVALSASQLGPDPPTSSPPTRRYPRPTPILDTGLGMRRTIHNCCKNNVKFYCNY